MKYWLKILNMSDDSFPKIIFTMQKNDTEKMSENSINYVGANWAFQIKSILETHGLGYLWYNQNTESVPFSLIKQRILDNYHQTWYADINNSHRLSTLGSNMILTRKDI